MNEQQAKEKAMQGVGQPVNVIRPRGGIAREMRIEALDGGFVVTHFDEWSNADRRIVPNADALGSFVQKWAGEGQQSG